MMMLGLNPGLLRHWHWQSDGLQPLGKDLIHKSFPTLLQPSENLCGFAVWYFFPKSMHLGGRDKSKEKEPRSSLSVFVWELADGSKLIGGYFFRGSAIFYVYSQIGLIFINCFKQYRTSSAASQIPLVAKNIGSDQGVTRRCRLS